MLSTSKQNKQTRVSVRGSFRVRVRVSVSVSIVYYAAGEGSAEGLAPPQRK